MTDQQREQTQLNQAATTDDRHRLGREFGWKSHDAIQAWTSSVDSKASICLVVETAVLGAACKSYFGRGGQLHAMDGAVGLLATTSILLLGCAVGLALLTVYPRLKRRAIAKSRRDGLIYFGHLKDRTVAEITGALVALTPDRELHQLAAQLQATSEVAWKKHAYLQASLIVFALGVLSLMLALAIG